MAMAQKVLDAGIQLEKIELGSANDPNSYTVTVRRFDGTSWTIADPGTQLQPLVASDILEMENKLKDLDEQQATIIQRREQLKRVIDTARSSQTPRQSQSQPQSTSQAQVRNLSTGFLRK